MKKSASIMFLSTMLAMYLAMIAFSIYNTGLSALPVTTDPQVIQIVEGELLSNGQRTNITLPSYFDVEGETKLQFTLDYAFTSQTVPSLILQANHTFMTILLDGVEIYHVEPQSYSLGNYVAHIPLPQQVSEGKLEINIQVPASGLRRVEVPKLAIADEAVYLRKQITKDLPSLLLNTLILLSSVILMALALVGRKIINPHKMLLRGFLALNSASYFMCETYIVVLLAPNARTIYTTDLLAFSALCPPLLVLLAWELDDWRKKALNLIAGLSIVGALSQVVLSATTGTELRQLLPITHTVQLIGIIAIVVCIGYGILRKKSNGGLYIGGLIALGGAIDLILFMCEIGQSNVFFVKIGLLIYLFQQMVQFVKLLMKLSAEEARESYYKTLALQDPLSSCYSRAAFEIDRSAWDGEIVRTVFFIDLNDLKTTNDLFGHSAGDQIIHALGGVLNRVFFSVGKCYRVGGDEFWVVCDGLAPGQSSKMIHAAQKESDQYNYSSNLPIKLSYAIGVSDTKETNGDLNRAIELADERMYQNKRAMKQKDKRIH